MVQSFKNIFRKLAFSIGLDFTKNLQYDRQTLAIMRKVLKKDSNTIDIGCHKGEVMDELVKIAPDGHHYGFEPIPEYYNFLVKKYDTKKNIHIIGKALSDASGVAEFNWVKNAPAYSGLKQRAYAIKNPEILKIEVDLAMLDEIGTNFTNISFIKIDVEGAEMKVLHGGQKFIVKHKPVIIFECGMGASDFYGVKPDDVFLFFDDIKYQINTLKRFINGEQGLSKNNFMEIYNKNIDYYFVAVPFNS